MQMQSITIGTPCPGSSLALVPLLAPARLGSHPKAKRVPNWSSAVPTGVELLPTYTYRTYRHAQSFLS